MRLVSSLMVLGLLVPGPAYATTMTNSGKQPPGDNDARAAPQGNNATGPSQWSEERMRKAKPTPLPRVDPKRDKRD